MEEATTLSTYTLIDLVKKNEQLKNENSNLIDKNRELLQQNLTLKNKVLECSEIEYRFKDNTLSECLSLNSSLCPISAITDLLMIGFAVGEVREYIEDRWHEYHKGGE